MRYEKYQLFTVGEEYASFDFVSDGPRGAVPKRIVFIQTSNPPVFNLAFGDLEPGTGKVNDKVITNNGDRDKVLATIAGVIDRYTMRYPDRWILIEGSTASRTRLYRMIITVNLKELSKTFNIFGIIESDAIVPFASGSRFRAFLIKRRN